MWFCYFYQAATTSRFNIANIFFVNMQHHFVMRHKNIPIESNPSVAIDICFMYLNALIVFVVMWDYFEIGS